MLGAPLGNVNRLEFQRFIYGAKGQSLAQMPRFGTLKLGERF